MCCVLLVLAVFWITPVCMAERTSDVAVTGQPEKKVSVAQVFDHATTHSASRTRAWEARVLLPPSSPPFCARM